MPFPIAARIGAALPEEEEEEAVDMSWEGKHLTQNQFQGMEIRVQPPERRAAGPPPWSVAAHITVSSTIGYILVYFLRYPIIMLKEVRSRKFGTIYGVEFLVEDSMSVAFLLGFAIAKLPAALVMTSPMFFRHRFGVIALLNALTAVLISCPVAFSSGDPVWTTCGLFLGCFPTSWVYGGLVSYYEGRTTTELILAVSTPGMIMAGGLSRGAAQFALDNGVPEQWTPLLIAALVLLPMTACFFLLDLSPSANAYDMERRKERKGMSMQERKEFIIDFACPLALLIAAYSVLTALRQFRDLDTRSLFKASNGGKEPPVLFYSLVDVLPALAGFINLMFINSVQDNYLALLTIFCLMAGMLVFSLISTGLFIIGVIDGLVWQVTVGIGIWGAYSVTVPIWDRMVAVSPMAGATCTFLMFVADMAGYLASISLTFWKRFAAPNPTLDVLLGQFVAVLCGGSLLIIVLLGFVVVYFRLRQRREESILRTQDGRDE